MVLAVAAEEVDKDVQFVLATPPDIEVTLTDISL